MNLITIMKEDNWIWFDLDDTLYDFRRSSDVALRGIYDARGLDRWFGSPDRWKEIYHRHNAALWELYNAGTITKDFLKLERFRRPLVEAGAPDDIAVALSLDMDGDYLHRLAATGFTLPGANDLLRDLRREGLRIGILSNGFTEVQYDKLSSAGLDSLVDCVVLSDEIGVNKPRRELFDYALEKSGADVSRCVMVGDNPDTDIAGAIAAGWRAILFNPATDTLLSLLPRLLP